MGKKVLAKVVDHKDVSPSWKVLQMKLNEEKANSSQTVLVVSKKSAIKKSRKRIFQDAVSDATSKDVKPAPTSETNQLGKLVALDCEYVGGGERGEDDLLARVSIVDENGEVIYDKYVKPREKVTDYRTAVSGIRPADIVNGMPFQSVQFETAKLLKGRIVVGHAIHNDFRVLNIVHNRKETRDTAKCSILKQMANYTGRSPSLKKLAQEVLGIAIQKGEHDSVTDARTALQLYKTVKKQWEAEIKRFHRNK